MKYNTPRKTLSKAYLKSKVLRNEMERFKESYNVLSDKIEHDMLEEQLKIVMRDFLLDAYYKGKYVINVKDRKDLVIYDGPKSTDNVAVIIEAKSIKNKSEMISRDNLNAKAMQEILLYYLRERVDKNNNHIKRLIITNVHEWFIFDGNDFEKLVYRNRKLIKDYQEYITDKHDTQYFYNIIAKPFIESIKEDIHYTWFDIRTYKKAITNDNPEDDNKVIALFKLLSPTHILKLSFSNDSNSLNKEFYNELLHIIGLEEVKQKNKKIIQRKALKNREAASLLENTINILRYETNVAEPHHYETALELCITWINRILFLKLLESQLVKYHKGNKEYQFLNYNRIPDYDTLNRLFFQVLAIRPEERRDRIKEVYSKVPYLNSSLFEVNELERKSLKVSNLEDQDLLSIHTKTVLKDSNGKRAKGKLNTLDYLFQFLEAYDFSSEGGEQIQEENKTLINASVLGLIFEKINGYKDGSFFTPGFITMYMCNETIRRAVLQKFREHTDYDSDDWDELKNYIGKPYKKADLQKYNELIDGIKICDPAVGSGHFLVSALNEFIAIKSELNILSSTDYDKLPVIAVVDNDELIIQNDNEENDLYEYDYTQAQSGIIQKALFDQKQKIIENCLFGVDINPNSVKICRLRLWIELLKNAYYTEESNYTDLETLPNIDINIKCGNSLISRFDLDSDLKPALKKSKFTIDSYKAAVASYKQATNKADKLEFKSLIEGIKSDFRSEVHSKEIKDLQKMEGQFYDRFGAVTLIDVELTKAVAKKKATEKKKLLAKIDKKKAEIEEVKNNKIYENAFEWRFEFPEVLDDDGAYEGFDIVIGNPPYISLTKLKEESVYYSKAEYNTYSKGADIYCLFYELGGNILKGDSYLTFITSNSWLRAIYGELLKNHFTENLQPVALLNIEDIQIFEEATVESNIIILQKRELSHSFPVVNMSDDYEIGSSLSSYFSKYSFDFSVPSTSEWFIGNQLEGALKIKIEQNAKLLKEFSIRINFGIKTGYNNAFIISKEKRQELIVADPNCEQIIKPIIRGRDLSKYEYAFDNVYIINSHNGLKKIGLDRIDVEIDFPVILEHLNKFLPKVKLRYDKGDHWSNLRNCAYLEDFEKPKIIWGEISDKPKFAYDDDNYYAEATAFLMTGEKLKFLLGILNSKLSEWYFNLIGTTTGMGTNRWKKYKIEMLPIMEPSEQQEKIIEGLVDEIIAAKKANADSIYIEKKLDQLIYDLYSLSADEIKIIEESVNK